MVKQQQTTGKSLLGIGKIGVCYQMKQDENGNIDMEPIIVVPDGFHFGGEVATLKDFFDVTKDPKISKLVGQKSGWDDVMVPGLGKTIKVEPPLPPPDDDPPLVRDLTRTLDTQQQQQQVIV